MAHDCDCEMCTERYEQKLKDRTRRLEELEASLKPKEKKMTQTAKINHHVELPDSTAIHSLGYDPGTAVLEIDWLDSGTGELKRYRYYGVDATTYAELLNAPSAGKFVNERIKGIYPVRRKPVTVVRK